MLSFPKSTEVNQRISKQKFYSNLNFSTKLENLFTKEIEKIIWKNKFSKDTLNISEGIKVKEIQLFELELKEQCFSKELIAFIDKEIPYHIVFLFKYINQYQLCIAYKEESLKYAGKFIVDKYFFSEWLDENQVSLKLEGINLDYIYMSFITQISQETLVVEDDEDLKTAIDKSKEKLKIEVKIKSLEIKLTNEKQFKKQVELNNEIKRLKRIIL